MAERGIGAATVYVASPLTIDVCASPPPLPPRFDGGYSSDRAASLKTVLLQQPNAVGFGGWGISPSPATWDGTESGHPNCPAGIWATGNSHCGDPSSPDYVPKTCDTTLQNGDHWFWTPPATSVRTLPQLIDLYHDTVGSNGYGRPISHHFIPTPTHTNTYTVHSTPLHAYPPPSYCSSGYTTFPPPVLGLKHVHAPRARGTSHCTLLIDSLILTHTTHVPPSFTHTCHPYPSSRRSPPHPQPYHSVLELDFAINRDGLVDPVHEVRIRVNTKVSV